MEIGNWIVDDKGISFNHGQQRFVIDQQQLLRVGRENGERNGLYEWILLATDEAGLTEDDLYDLNFAFVYAAARTGGDFDYDVFDRTIAYQFALLDDDEDAEPPLSSIPADDADAEQQRKEALSERD